MELPKSKPAHAETLIKRRLFIGAYGFEDRSVGWVTIQNLENIVQNALIVKYENPKGKNKVLELKKSLKKIGVKRIKELKYGIITEVNIEEQIENELEQSISDYEEVILDITALTKFLILIFLCKLSKYQIDLKIVYSEAKEYAPSFQEYQSVKDRIRKVINFPSRGFGTILRAKCLSSIRMQGQPVTLIAFTSFNEQLVRHMLGTMNPHRIIFINGRPPRIEFKWRERATIDIHRKLISEYPVGNEFNEQSELVNTCSTFDYLETVNTIDKIYYDLNLYERIIIAATGSKMQTVGLFFSKIKHPDIHIEYPTPDSYYIKGFSNGMLDVHEIFISNFSELVSVLSSQQSN